jgi:Na+/proline symporter
LVLLYLTVGALLFVLYQSAGAVPPAKSDLIIPDFTRRFAVPDGLRGLILAAVVLANIDSPLSSLSASFVTDIYKPLFKSRGSERHYMMVSRICIGVFGLILGVTAYAFSFARENLLWVAVQILVVLGGGTLGVFLLGMTTKIKADKRAVAAMVVATAQMILLYWLSVNDLYPVGWTWLIVLGTAETYVLGWLFAQLGKKAPAADKPSATPP